MNDGESTFVPLLSAARILGVPSAWLKREAEAGRVPSVRAGRRLLVHVVEAERVLLARAAEGGDGHE